MRINKPFKRHFALIMACIMLASLTGCNSAEDYSVNTSEVKNISFSWWGNDPRHIYTMEGVDVFNAKNTDIHVEIKYGIWNGYETRNKVYMNSHTEPDVMQINYNWISQYSGDGNGYYDLYQLRDYLDLSGYTESDLSFGEVNGKLNALPIAYNSTVLYYNKDIYDRYGLDIPSTWDDLFDAAAKMRDDGIYPLGAVKKHIFLLLVAYFEQTTGKTCFSEDGVCQLNEDDFIYMLEFYKKLIDEKAISPIDQFDRNLLSAGELAGTVCWISDISNYCSSIEAAGTPALGRYLCADENEKLTGWYKKPATMYAISASTENPEASARLLNYLVNDQDMAILQGTEKGIPVSSYALKAIDEAGLLEGYSVDANNQMLNAGDALKILIPAMEDEKGFIDVFKSEADAYIYGKATVEDTAKAIVEGIKK